MFPICNLLRSRIFAKTNSVRLISYSHEHFDFTFTSSKEVYGQRSTVELKKTLKHLKSLLFTLGHQSLGRRPIEKALGTVYNEWILMRWAMGAGGRVVCSEKPCDSINKIVENCATNFDTMLVCYPTHEDLKNLLNVCNSDLTDSSHTRNSRHTQAENSDFSRQAINIMAKYMLNDSESKYDENLELFKQAVDTVADNSHSGKGMVSVKLSTLGKPYFLCEIAEILLKCNNLLKNYETKTLACLPEGVLDHQQQSLKNTFRDINLELANEDPMKWFFIVDSKKNYNINWHKLMAFDSTLSDIFKTRKASKSGYEKLLLNVSPLHDVADMRRLLLRFRDLIEHAQQRSVSLAIDAEQQFVQPAIRRIVLEAMRKYNIHNVTIYSTYQAYLKECLRDITIDMTTAERNKFCFGARLVRGENWKFEKQLANRLDSNECPVYTSFGATTAMFETVFQAVLQNIRRRTTGDVVAMLASHNEQSIRYAVGTSKAAGLLPSDGTIRFAQWQGVSDYVSTPLTNAGYTVYKALPCGSQASIARHLERVLVDNERIWTVIDKECFLIGEELKRR